MWGTLVCLLATVIVAYGMTRRDVEDLSEAAAINHLKNLEEESGKVSNLQTLASWEYETNITEENLAKKVHLNLINQH